MSSNAQAFTSFTESWEKDKSMSTQSHLPSVLFKSNFPDTLASPQPSSEHYLHSGNACSVSWPIFYLPTK